MSSLRRASRTRLLSGSAAIGTSLPHWAAFVSEARNSPEAREKYTGVPAAALRGAARLYATGGNGAIYYGLGVTEHSQGSTTVMAIANLAMATGNIGRPGVGVNPLARSEQRAGLLRHGVVPPRAAGLPAHLRRCHPPELRGGLGRAARKGAWPSHPEHARRGRRWLVQGPLHPGRGHFAVRSRHKACVCRACSHGMRRGAGSIPERNGELRACFPAGLDLPGEERNVYQRRAAHSAGPQGHGAAEWQGRLGNHGGALGGPRVPHALRSPIPDHGGGCAAHAKFRGRFLCEAG